MNKITNQEKHNDLNKYRELVLATLDYYIESPKMKIKSDNFNSDEHYRVLKNQAEELYQNQRLTKLKQWFRDLTEWPREIEDFSFNDFIKVRTGHDINLHERFDKRISRILDRNKIKTANEYRDVLTKVDALCQAENPHQELIEELNSLLADFAKKKK